MYAHVTRRVTSCLRDGLWPCALQFSFRLTRMFSLGRINQHSATYHEFERTRDDRRGADLQHEFSLVPRNVGETAT